MSVQFCKRTAGMSFFTRTTSQRFQGKFVWKKHVTVQERMDKNFENNRCGSG